jgi:hypothetical protein
VTREELRRKLWPADTLVDFDHGRNAALRRSRAARANKRRILVVNAGRPGVRSPASWGSRAVRFTWPWRGGRKTSREARWQVSDFKHPASTGIAGSKPNEITPLVPFSTATACSQQLSNPHTLSQHLRQLQQPSLFLMIFSSVLI